MDIKVQRGVAIIPQDESEVVVELDAPVNPEKTVVIFGGSIYGYDSTGSAYWDARLDLIDEQHVKATRSYPSFYTAEVSWQVLEFVKE